MLSSSQSRTAPSRNGNVQFTDGPVDDGYDYAPEASRAKRRQSRGNILFHERGIPTDVLRPKDSNSVAGGSETTYVSKRLDVVAPGDSASANGQTRASGTRGRRGPATAAGSDGQDDDSLLSNSQARGGDGPVDDWVGNSQGAQAFASDQNAVKDWQTKAREILDSSKDFASKNNQDRYEWWYKANIKKNNLEKRFKKLSAIDQGVCQPLMTEVMQLVDDEKAVGEGGRDTGGTSRESLTGDIEEKKDILKDVSNIKGASGQVKNSPAGVTERKNRHEGITIDPEEPLSPAGRTVQGGQPSQHVEARQSPEPTRRGKWHNHLHD